MSQEKEMNIAMFGMIRDLQQAVLMLEERIEEMEAKINAMERNRRERRPTFPIYSGNTNMRI